MKRLSSGFSLIELLIVLVVIAIISVIAIPSYKEQVDRGRRAEAKAYLMELASRQERFFTQYSSYADKIHEESCLGASCGLGMANDLSQEGHYQGSLSATPDSCTPTGTLCISFVLAATAINLDEKCPTLTLDHTGKKGVQDETDPVIIDYCWR